MKVNEKRIYPYPVYREGSDDYKSVGFETNIELLYNNEQATIQFKILIEDNEADKYWYGCVCMSSENYGG